MKNIGILLTKRLIFVSLFQQALSQSTGVTQSNTAYSNASSLGICGPCTVNGQLENQPFIPVQTPLRPSYITELVEVNSNGTVTQYITDRSVSESFRSYLSDFFTSISGLVQAPGEATIVPVDSINPTVTWEFYVSDAQFRIIGLQSGTRTCITTSTFFEQMNPESLYTITESLPETPFTPSTGVATILGEYFPFFPVEYLSSLGLPPNCKLYLGGAPLAQIPVQYLTITSTKDNVEHTATPTAPASPGSGLQLPGPTPTAETSPSVPFPGVTYEGGSTQPSLPPQETPDASHSPSITVPIQTGITLAGVPFSISGSSIFIGSQTILPGGSPVVYNGVSISLAPSATAMVIGTSTIQLSPSPAAAPAATPTPTFQFGSSTYTADAAGAFTIESQTLTPGGVITVSGTQISLAPSATAVVIDGSTTPLYAPSTPGTANVGPEMLTLGSDIYTANSASDFVINGQTLTPGGVITVDGTVISLAPGATQVVVGSSTEVFAEGSAASSIDVGGVIYSVFGGGSDGGSGSQSATATGIVGSGFATAAGNGRAVALEEKWMLWTLYFVVGLVWMIW